MVQIQAGPPETLIGLITVVVLDKKILVQIQACPTKIMDKSRHTLRVAVYLLLIKDEQILLQKRFNTGWMDGKYSLISGHLDGDETVTQAMIREAKEEAGLTLVKENIKVIHVQNRLSNYEYIDFYFEASKWGGEPKVLESNKASEIVWFKLDNLPPETLPYIKNVLENYKKGLFYSEFGF